MKVDIYHSATKRLKFLFVPEGTDVTGTNLNLDDPDFRKITLLHKGTTSDPTIIGVSPEALTKGIEEKGYYISEIVIKVDVIDRKKP
ncbi:hypothetical protein [Rahnella aceris]